MSIKEPTWEDVDNIVKMVDKATGKPFSLSNLELAFDKSDTVMINDIVAALQSETSKYSSEIYLYRGIRMVRETQIKRMKGYYTDGVLCKNIYLKVLELASDAAKVAATFPAPAPVMPTPLPIPTSSQTVAAPTVSNMTMNIRDRISFNRLSGSESTMSYVPYIDDHYVFPDFTLEFVRMMDNSLNIWLYGGTGCGKSSLVEQVCATGKLPLIYQSFHEDIKPDQLFGGKELVDGNTVWADGPVTKAYREGLVLLLDEIDGLPPEIQFCLYGVLDRKPLLLAENNNEVVKPHPNFRVVATGNTHGRGDDTGMFAGTNILNRAFLNRYRVWYKVEYPSEEIYRSIIENEGVKPAIAKVIARLAKEINMAYESDTLTETFSLRDAREVAKVSELVDGDVGRALSLTLLNRLSSIEKNAVVEIFRRIVPSSIVKTI